MTLRNFIAPLAAAALMQTACSPKEAEPIDALSNPEAFARSVVSDIDKYCGIKVDIDFSTCESSWVAEVANCQMDDGTLAEIATGAYTKNEEVIFDHSYRMVRSFSQKDPHTFIRPATTKDTTCDTDPK